MGFRDKLKNVFKANKQEKQMSVDNVSDVSKQENKDTETTLNNRLEVKPVVLELTYGLERIAMYSPFSDSK